MRLCALISLSFVPIVLAQTADLSSLLAQWSAVAPPVTRTFDMPNQIPTRLGNVDPPPTSLMLAIFTGVPSDVMMDLMDPEGRASIKSEFAAGNTPEWYANLPTPVKSYLESINKAIATGGTQYTGTEGPPEIPNFTATPGTIATSAGVPKDGGDGNVAATSSKAGVPPKPTWGATEVVGLSGAVAVLGIAIGL